jgi:hypothetical protein
MFSLPVMPQESTKAVLIDEFPATLNCEDVLARTDNLAISLKESPGHTGVIVIRGYKDLPDLNSRKHAWPIHFIHRALVASTVNDADVSLLDVQGSERSVQFWIVPPGATFELKGARLIGSIPFKVNARIFYATDDSGPCSGQIFRGFKSLLNANQNLTGYVVNINVPKGERKATLRHDLETFREHGLRNRGIRIYFKNVKVPSAVFYGHTQYWLKPKKR